MNTIKKCFLISLILVTALTGFTQKKKTFVGTITYSIDIDGEIDAQMRAQMPTEMVMYVSENKIRNDQVSPFYSIAAIVDIKTSETTIMMDMMGQKIAYKQTKEDIDKAKEGLKEEDKESKPEIKYIDETKVIAGYKCKKAEVKTGDEVSEVYYTNEIAIPEMPDGGNTSIKGLDGFLMQYSMPNQNFTMILTVKEVKAGKVKPKMFIVTDEYEMKSAEEMRSLLGQ